MQRNVLLGIFSIRFARKIHNKNNIVFFREIRKNYMNLLLHLKYFLSSKLVLHV